MKRSRYRHKNLSEYYSHKRINKQVIIVVCSAGLLLIAVLLGFSLKNYAADASNVKHKYAATYCANTAIADNKVSQVLIVNRWELPDDLKEISGISFVDNTRIACVQDELGKVYIFNIANNKIEKEHEFRKAGDYEGITMVGKSVWVLRSDGSLFEISDVNASNSTVKQFRTQLTAKEDCEGLCYDRKNQRLLIAIKGKDPNSNDYKGVYGFELNSHTLAKEPVFRINVREEMADKNITGKKRKKGKAISPSDIAINPTTRELYIIDGANSSMIITDEKGSIRQNLKLDKKMFPQPEGIAFNNKGDLYISNEGPKGPGTILQVKL